MEKDLPEFIVAKLGDKVIGCACLDIGRVVELRSIAVLPSFRDRGAGSRLVDNVLERAKELSDTLYLRTTSPGFFEKKGFMRLEDHEKKAIWDDCAQCDKYNNCRQVLMIRKFNR